MPIPFFSPWNIFSFTLGFTRKMIGLLIVFQNLFLTLLSIFLAGILSFLFLFLKDKYRVIQIPKDVYFINYLPVSFEQYEIVLYYLFFFMISVIISFIPAYKLYSLNSIKSINSHD